MPKDVKKNHKQTFFKGIGSNGLNKTPEKSIFTNVFFYLLLGLILLSVISPYIQEQATTVKKPISDVYKLILEDKVTKVTVHEDKVKVDLKDGSSFTSEKEPSISFDEMLTNNSIDKNKISEGIEVKQTIPWAAFWINVAQIALPILFILFLFRQVRGAGNDVFAFGKSKAKLFNKNSPQLKFTDVAGNDEAKRELVEIVDFLKNPGKYRALGARVPKGVLLVGPSGVGKTMLAKAIAGEAGVPFFSVAGSEFMEMLVGVGSARVRDLFDMAKAAQPALIFIDEIDAIGRQRGMGIGGGHDEREQTLNQILVEMDGFDPRVSVIVIAATNRPDMLDPALVRPGRFDRRVVISLPDLREREEIIKIHMRGKPFVDGVNTERLARRTVGFSGADIENMINEAAILAASLGKKAVDEKDVEEAALKVQLGPEKKKLQTEEERKVVAYHEAGHAVVAAFTKGMDPVHRISIISRGMSLGFTLFPPTSERFNDSKSRLLSMITTSLGGRSAEELMFGDITVGASNDIEKATEIARKMVTEFGMSDLGPISYNSEGSRYWLAMQMGESKPYSEEMASKIDQEVRKIIDKSHEDALKILTEHKDKLIKVAQELMLKETLEAEEFETLVGIKVTKPLG
ncbi:MAG: ATP-dependent zinc metalloprotease FtsH [Patescibacteria group bacterium]